MCFSSTDKIYRTCRQDLQNMSAHLFKLFQDIPLDIKQYHWSPAELSRRSEVAAVLHLRSPDMEEASRGVFKEPWKILILNARCLISSFWEYSCRCLECKGVRSVMRQLLSYCIAFLRFPSAEASDFLPGLVPSATAVKHLAARHPVGLQ